MNIKKFLVVAFTVSTFCIAYLVNDISKCITNEKDIITTETINNVTTVQTTVSETEYTTEILETTVQNNNYFNIEINPILQNPELPTGCEVTSLAIVLNFYGYQIDKCLLSDNYLPKGDIGTVSPWDKFLGNPRNASSLGCFAEVIRTTAISYLAYNEGFEEVFNISGCSTNELYSYVANGIPVIVWATINMQNTYVSGGWNIDGEFIEWKKAEHCMVLTGYDLDKNIVYISDPLRGNVSYDKDLFETRWNQMYNQAVVIY